MATQPPPADARHDGASRMLRLTAENLALAVIYFGVAKISLAAATEHRVVSAIWPPAGIALFALLRFGIGHAPGVAIGAFALNASSGVAPLPATGIAIGDMLEALVGARLVIGALGPRISMERVRDVVAVTLLGAVLATTIAATIGVATLLLTGGTTPDAAPWLWVVWWSGDAIGVLLVTPFLLSWASPERSAPVRPGQWLEAAGLFFALALVTDWLFGQFPVMAFAIYPLAMLISWRLGPRAATAAAAVVALDASLRTLAGEGPFTGFTPMVNLFVLQVFLALLAAKTLLFAAARAERQAGIVSLKSSEARYRMLAQKLPEGAVVLYDRDLRLLLVEGPAVSTAGFSKEAVEGKRLADVFDAQHAKALEAQFAGAFSGKEAEFEFSYQDRLYLVRVLPTEDEHGEPVGMALAIDVTARDRAQREVAESRTQLRQLSRLLLTAQEDERRRIAREVHDELGQALTAVKIGLSHVTVRAQRRSSLESERRTRQASDILDNAIESVQRIVLRLRPGVLDHLGPLAALQHEVQQFREQSSLAVTLSLPPTPPALDADQSTVIYRTVQESLTNVLRHAEASVVSVTLMSMDHDIVLQVADDGVGIAEDQVSKPRSMGLLGMRERALSCGGELHVTRRPAGGTCVTLRMPLRRAANGAVRL